MVAGAVLGGAVVAALVVLGVTGSAAGLGGALVATLTFVRLTPRI